MKRNNGVNYLQYIINFVFCVAYSDRFYISHRLSVGIE
ncbi:hypothetical protein HC081234_22360 [Helicobacter cinaedi]|nr:hypothetical protein HC081234_22360 [Helicobacter cinaedi]